ncbi:extracellular solute-binding protein [Erysipelothrix sp. HDW6C]|uniref:extracellular solute-binding protein n=1 Tax=Erysipelothrix sp. HDW6C TaxID=2714930 RepID=UPI0014097EFF|nr:extracellular solute-binding protein [Erysipelothrix sp. HDW6C]QIK70536.1 extracellular solute-binding protein [Erysipelothrix sp. HDW6C]
MKNIKKFLVVLLAVLVLVGCSSGSGDKGNADIVTDVPEGTEITFWHGMNGGQEEALTKITADFMAANPNIKVVLQNQSSYKDLQAKINSTMTSPANLPTITQAYSNWLYNVAEEDILVDLTPYINHKEIGIENLDDIVPALLDGAKINGTQFGLPFNKSTEVLYYNPDMLAEYGVEVPTTMEEFATASKTIYEKSGGKVVGGGFDSLNNYYAIGMANKGVEFNKDLDVTSKESLEVVKYYQDGVKEGYFRIAGSDKYLSGPFGNELIAMNIGSMAGESNVRKATEGKFEYGVALRPSEKNIQQGTDVFMFNNATPEQKTAAFKYMAYLVSEEAQLYWSTSTGYMPARTSVINSEAYKGSKSKIAALIGDASKNLFAIPVVENSDPVYNLSREMMELILSDPSKDAEAVLKDYQAKFTATWNQ